MFLITSITLLLVGRAIIFSERSLPIQLVKEFAELHHLDLKPYILCIVSNQFSSILNKKHVSKLKVVQMSMSDKFLILSFWCGNFEFSYYFLLTVLCFSLFLSLFRYIRKRSAFWYFNIIGKDLDLLYANYDKIL